MAVPNPVRSVSSCASHPCHGSETAAISLCVSCFLDSPWAIRADDCTEYGIYRLSSSIENEHYGPVGRDAFTSIGCNIRSNVAGWFWCCERHDDSSSG